MLGKDDRLTDNEASAEPEKPRMMPAAAESDASSHGHPTAGGDSRSAIPAFWARVKRPLPAIPVVAACLLILAFYLWTASNGLPFGVGRPQEGYYNLLTRALLRGHLHLPVEPRSELFELADPYDPGKNAPYRLHDASLYRGKYYLYFGVAPALTLFAPWRLLGLGDLPENLAAAIFASGGFLFAVGLLRYLTRMFLPLTPPWMQTAAVLVLGGANVCPFILRGSEVYQVAITAGSFFLIGGAYLMMTSASAPRPWLRIAGGSLLLGLAVGSRPNHLLISPLVLLLAWPAVRTARDRPLAKAVLALLPFGVCLLVLAAYNHARFGSFTEFGLRYQLVGTLPLPWFDPRGLVPGLYFYFVAPLALRLGFPCVFLDSFYPGSLPPGYFGPDPNAGVLVHSPFLLILFAAPWLLRGSFSLFRERIAVLLGIGAGHPLLTSVVLPGASMRHQVDFVSFLIVPALLLWFLADQRSSGRVRLALRAVAALTMAWACLVNAALSLTGWEDTLRLENPELFRSLERRFEPLRVGLARLLVRDGRHVVRMRVAFPERSAGGREPFLSSGSVAAHDLIWARALSPGQWSFILQPARGPEQEAPPFRLEAGRFYACEVELDRIRGQVLVRLDGIRVASLPGRLEPVRENTTWVGRGPKGRGALNLGRFSGVILTQGMLWAAPPGLETLPPIAASPAIHTRGADEPPPAPLPGRLWVPASRDGAYLYAGPGWRWIPLYFLDRVRVDRKVTLSALPPGTVEPILVSGDEAAANGLFARHLGGGRVTFGLAMWRGTWQMGPAGPAVDALPGRPQALSVILDRPAGFALVLLGGREVLHGKVELAPIPRAGLSVLESPPGMILGRPSFSGQVLPAGKGEN